MYYNFIISYTVLGRDITERSETNNIFPIHVNILCTGDGYQLHDLKLLANGDKIWADRKQEVEFSFQLQNMADEIFHQSGAAPHFELRLYASDSAVSGSGTQTDLTGAISSYSVDKMKDLVMKSGEIMNIRNAKVSDSQFSIKDNY